MQIIQLVDDPLKVAHPIAVAVFETARVDLVDDGMLEPMVFVHPPINNPITELGLHLLQSCERPAMMRHIVFWRQGIQRKPFGLGDVFTRSEFHFNIAPVME